MDPSVFVRMPVVSGELAEKYRGPTLLVWTTTPWTLVSNTAVAVSPNADYDIVRTTDDETLVVASALREQLVADSTVLETVPGTALEHTSYLPPFELVEVPEAHYVILGDYVTTEDGSGLVHIAPAFGADDLIVARNYDLPVVNPVHADGTFHADVPLVGGMFFKGRRPSAGGRPRGPWAAVRQTRLRAQVPALLALPHAAALLRAALVVHPHHRHRRTTPGAEPGDQLVPGHHQERSLRGLAGQQHRLGAVAQPLLGHAAAAVALRAGPRHRGGVVAGPVGSGGPRPGRTGSAPAIRRRRRDRLRDLR